MARDVKHYLELLGEALTQLPGVFSTPQWGGRAYKLPGPNGNTRKPKLLAFVDITKEGDAVHVSFKLDKERARTLTNKYTWLGPHGFRTLAPSGWVTAQVSTKREINALLKLLTESHNLYSPTPGNGEPRENTEPTPPDCGGRGGRGGRGGSSETARHIDRVMSEARTNGWQPPDAEMFAD